MKRISIKIILPIFVLIILVAFFLYPRGIEGLLDIEQNDINQLKIDYDLLVFGDDKEINSLIVIDDKETIIKIMNTFNEYKYSKKYLLFEPKPKSTPNEKIHFRIFYGNPVKVDMLTINENGEIIIFTTQKGRRTYNIVGNRMDLFSDIKSLLGLTTPYHDSMDVLSNF